VQEVASGLFLCFPFSVIVMARKLFAAFLLSLQLLGIAAAGYTVDYRAIELNCIDDLEPGTTYTLDTDSNYDNKNGQLTTSACSSLPYSTFSDIPTFPNIGGLGPFAEKNCGTCWKLTYGEGLTKRCVNIFVMDSAAKNTFLIAPTTADKLTGGKSAKGTVNIKAKQIDKSKCGIRD